MDMKIIISSIGTVLTLITAAHTFIQQRTFFSAAFFAAAAALSAADASGDFMWKMGNNVSVWKVE